MSSSDLGPATRLFSMPLRQEQDVVLCRNRARHLSSALGFDHLEQVRIATAVSEIARNAFRYAKDGVVEFSIICDLAPRKLIVQVNDHGEGIAELAAVLNGTYRSETGLGMGIIGAKRLMDHVDIASGPDGTTIVMHKELPPGATVQFSDCQKIVDDLNLAIAATPLEEIAAQNQELVWTLGELREHKQQLDTINAELSETNRGVVALYDELDTVYRVGRVVANKLDLDSLIQAITDATTEVSGAEFGAFFHREHPDGELSIHAVAGALRAPLSGISAVRPVDLFGTPAPAGEVVRVSDLATESVPISVARELPIRSYLAMPVQDSAGNLAAVLIFGHRMPAAFTERTERILVSVAVQTSIGLENARLYRNAQAANAAKDHFLAVLSHELRTPLNPVFAILSELLDNPNLPKEISADLQFMQRNLQLEARLIDDLLDLTRIVKGKIPLQQEVTDIHALLESALKTCATAAEKQKVHVTLELDAPQHHVTGDAARLQQVFWNLLNNAVKFTPAGGNVVIRTSQAKGRTICVEIEDTGRGIEKSALATIFKPFEQGGALVTSQFGGLGLGLTISKKIVDAHGGEIWAESEGLGQGAKFYVRLQLKDVPVPVPAEPRVAPQTLQPQGIRILLVDDHEDTRHAVQRLLTRRGHQVVTASNSHEALNLAHAQEFDLLISDLGLPDCSGHELVRRLHAFRNLPAIALSGYGMEADVERSHEAGFLAHLTKPVDINVLDATIEKILREG